MQYAGHHSTAAAASLDLGPEDTIEALRHHASSPRDPASPRTPDLAAQPAGPARTTAKLDSQAPTQSRSQLPSLSKPSSSSLRSPRTLPSYQKPNQPQALSKLPTRKPKLK